MTRCVIFFAMLMGCASLAMPLLVRPQPRLIWNATASAPIGLYLVREPEPLHLGGLVAVTPPDGLAAFLDARGYLPRGVPLIKHVVALPGASVCRQGVAITVDGLPVGEARVHDRKGRDLPVWQGCRVLGPGEVFLMNPDVPDSLDGRYFGPLPRAAIIARLRPIWLDDVPQEATEREPVMR